MSKYIVIWRMNMVKKLDIIIIVGLLILSFVPSFILGLRNNQEYTGTYAEISVAGKVIDKIYFKETEGEKEIPIKTSYGENTIHISKDGIYMSEADCTDEICLKDGMITKVGQSLVCLPHKLIIEIKGEYVESDDDIILSH